LLQRDQLGHQVVGRDVVDLDADEDDPLLEELVVRIHLLDAVGRPLGEGRQDVAALRSRGGHAADETARVELGHFTPSTHYAVPGTRYDGLNSGSGPRSRRGSPPGPRR